MKLKEIINILAISLITSIVLVSCSDEKTGVYQFSDGTKIEIKKDGTAIISSDGNSLQAGWIDYVVSFRNDDIDWAIQIEGVGILDFKNNIFYNDPSDIRAKRNGQKLKKK